MPKVISIVSGKGGCGKSLLTAVLGRALAREHQKVLIVDFDIFVRGLTVLLNDFGKIIPQNEMYLTTSGILGIFSEKSKDKKPLYFGGTNLLSIERFFECDVLPSVGNIADPLDYNDKDLSDQEFCLEVVNYLLKQEDIKKYDYILLDNRAGMDSLVYACCANSDIVLSIAEDDPVGKMTNLNLVNFIKYSKNLKNIYSIINKARKVRDINEIERRINERSDFSIVGVVPFDIEILENFGTEKFWYTVDETLYFKAIIDSWNRLAKTANLVPIKESNYNFPPKIFMDKSLGKFTLLERMLRVYSVVFIFSGIGVYAYSKFRFEQISMLDLVSLISVTIGVLSLLISTTSVKNFLFGRESKSRDSNF